uniref:Guanylate kinase-like domain-containing protein n=1 Tax=Steinernema glaseri TaxID=37863 RepID=A0A1I7YPH6_9BILA
MTDELKIVFIGAPVGYTRFSLPLHGAINPLIRVPRASDDAVGKSGESEALLTHAPNFIDPRRCRLLFNQRPEGLSRDVYDVVAVWLTITFFSGVISERESPF